jgi:hypothetical protein
MLKVALAGEAKTLHRRRPEWILPTWGDIVLLSFPISFFDECASDQFLRNEST